MVGEGQSGDGSSRLDSLLSGTLPLEYHEQTRKNLGPLLCSRGRFFLAAFDESKSETRPHCEALEQQFQWTSWENSDFTICGVHYRQNLVHKWWSTIRLDQHGYAHVIESLQCPSSARDDQQLTPWEI